MTALEEDHMERPERLSTITGTTSDSFESAQNSPTESSHGLANRGSPSGSSPELERSKHEDVASVHTARATPPQPHTGEKDVVSASNTVSSPAPPASSHFGEKNDKEPLEEARQVTSVGGDGSSTADDYTGPYKTYKRRWFGILAMVLLNIANSWGWLSFAAISADAADYYNLSSESPINWLSTVILFSYLASSPFVWWVLVKKNTRWALIICGTLSIIGNWVRYGGTVKKNFGAVMFGQILIGFAQPFALSAPAFYTDIWFTSRSRISANAIASLANPLGGAIAQLVGPAIVTSSDQMPTFILITAGVSTGCALFSVLTPATPPLPACPSSTIKKLSLKESFIKCTTSVPYWALWLLFSVYVGFFNAFSSYTAQIMVPYGYTSDEAGYAGAALIVAGIVCCAVSSPIIDRYHHQLWVMNILVPSCAVLYIGVIFMCSKDQGPGPYVVSALLGALSFILLPIFLEWCQEQFSPIDASVTSSLMWMGGQLLGAIFIIVMNALKYNDNQGNPPGNMRRALIFEAVIACVAILPLWFVRNLRTNIRMDMDSRR